MTGPSLTGRATAAYGKAQRAAKKAELAEKKRIALLALEDPEDPAVARARDEWARKTLDLRTAAADLAERLLQLPADPDDWTVRQDSDSSAHLERDGLAFTCHRMLSARGARWEIGVRLAGSDRPLRPIDSIEALGQFLSENAPVRKPRKAK